MTDVQVSNARRIGFTVLAKLSLVGVWSLALVVRIVFDWEFAAACSGFCSLEELFLDSLLITAPLVTWLYLKLSNVLLPPSILVKYLVGVLLVAYVVVSVSSVPSQAYLWRMESVLLEQVAAIQAGETPLASANRGFEIRVETGRVYWPRFDWGLSSHGLVYDPSGQIKHDEHAFGEQVTDVVHLRGPWFLCWFT